MALDSWNNIFNLPIIFEMSYDNKTHISHKYFILIVSIYLGILLELLDKSI